MTDRSQYRILFQAFDSGLAVIGETDDLGFARQVMLTAYTKLCTPGQAYPFLTDDAEPGGKTVPILEGDRVIAQSGYLSRRIYEPIVALYKRPPFEGGWEFVDSIGWTEDGVRDQ